MKMALHSHKHSIFNDPGYNLSFLVIFNQTEATKLGSHVPNSLYSFNPLKSATSYSKKTRACDIMT